MLSGTEHNKLDNYRNWFCNIGLPYFGYSEPMPAAKQKVGNMEYTFWDSFEFTNNPTIQSIMDYYETKYDLNVKAITFGQAMLFGQFMTPKKQFDRKNKRVYDVINEIFKTEEAGPVTLVLQLSPNETKIDSKTGEEIDEDNESTCKVYK
jgi:ubiquitin-activating enzyme E1